MEVRQLVQRPPGLLEEEERGEAREDRRQPQAATGPQPADRTDG